MKSHSLYIYPSILVRATRQIELTHLQGHNRFFVSTDLISNIGSSYNFLSLMNLRLPSFLKYELLAANVYFRHSIMERQPPYNYIDVFDKNLCMQYHKVEYWLSHFRSRQTSNSDWCSTLLHIVLHYELCGRVTQQNRFVWPLIFSSNVAVCIINTKSNTMTLRYFIPFQCATYCPLSLEESTEILGNNLPIHII